MTRKPSARRLLSHRLRGFAPHDSSLQALSVALATGVGHVEIDTRMTSDAQILVFHDAVLDGATNRSGPVCEADLTRAGRPLFAPAGPQVPLLSELADRFAELADGSVRLHVDLKDAGDEVAHVACLEDAGLIGRCAFVSWWPQALRALHEIAPSVPLYFSYVPLSGWLSPLRHLRGLVPEGEVPASLGGVVAAALDTGEQELSRVVIRPTPEDMLGSVAPPAQRRGHYPIHVLPRLPDVEFCELIARSGGGINVPVRCLSRSLVRDAHRRALAVGTFSAHSLGQARWILARQRPDIVYMDDGASLVGLWRRPNQSPP